MGVAAPGGDVATRVVLAVLAVLGVVVAWICNRGALWFEGHEVVLRGGGERRYRADDIAGFRTERTVRSHRLWMDFKNGAAIALWQPTGGLMTSESARRQVAQLNDDLQRAQTSSP
jgi:hypothetical protein